jgi:phytoene synthase
VSAAISTAEAYARCEAITRTQAANFFYGIRLLEGDRRRAMCAAYAFARRIDDIGDGELAREAKRELLSESAARLAELEADPARAAIGEDAVIVALADAHARFRLPAGALGELIDGVRMDVEETSYESFEQLELYCRRVAGTVGRVCLAIFATRPGAELGDGEQAEREHARREALADDLGVALQLTNILRDVREDAENGRVYLPAEDLRRFELPAGAGSEGARALLTALGEGAVRRAELVSLLSFEASRAERWFDRGMPLLALLDRRSAACVAAMAGIYHRLLERIEADPERVLRERVSLPVNEKLSVALRSILGACTSARRRRAGGSAA